MVKKTTSPQPEETTEVMGAETVAETEVETTALSTSPVDGGIPAEEFHAVAIRVSVRDIYPQESYGRAGYRFSKGNPTEIAMAELTADKLTLLYDDPWLFVEFITDK